MLLTKIELSKRCLSGTRFTVKCCIVDAAGKFHDIYRLVMGWCNFHEWNIELSGVWQDKFNINSFRGQTFTHLIAGNAHTSRMVRR